MAILTSYDLKGKKDSFANWISNLSPVDTFFVSTTKKEAVSNTLFQWQTDSLAAVDLNNAQLESSNAVAEKRKVTKVESNVTQILRKALEVTDTADSLDNWGRQKELAYQMEKAGKEIKRDLEAILLSAQGMQEGAEVDPPTADSGTDARKTKCFQALVAAKDAEQDDTKAKVHFETTANSLAEADVFKMTTNLYLAGSDANIIMYHPEHATFFSSLMETGNGRQKLIENMDTTLNKFVGALIDPLGQHYKLVPNRWMPKNVVYFFNPKDWTQMVLREPQKATLAKKGSSERWMVEMEVGLRHSNPFASGVLEIKA